MVADLKAAHRSASMSSATKRPKRTATDQTTRTEADPDDDDESEPSDATSSVASFESNQGGATNGQDSDAKESKSKAEAKGEHPNKADIDPVESGPHAQMGDHEAEPKDVIRVQVDDDEVELREQIQVRPLFDTHLDSCRLVWLINPNATQLYATNDQLTHPLVSPILQLSLGGLPPLLVVRRNRSSWFAAQAHS